MKNTGISQNNWDEIALKYGTDKASSHHGYMQEYENRLASKSVARLLEIGVAHGKSLAMWSEIFPDALIVGVDILPECRLYQRVKIDVLIADAADPAKMAAVSQLYGPFDVVIDDGEHDPNQVRAAFEELYPRLAAGGIYIIEDLEPESLFVKTFAKQWNADVVPCKDKCLIIINKI
jgi:demethylmacrocin O-methyltransferase